MKEVNFKDRVPLHPGRITLTPVIGSENTYVMERADEPTEQGTPLDKATFNSIIHSRLTGRYYQPTVTYTTGNSRTGLTVSPIPTSGWAYDASTTNRATNGSYAVETDSNNGSDWLADNAFKSGGWQNMGGVEAWLKIYHAAKLKVRSVRFEIEAQYTGRVSALKIQGSNNGTSWTDLHTVTSITFNSDVTYNLTSTGDYSYYRLLVTNTDSNRITIKDFGYVLYDVSSYTNAFNVSEGFPAVFTTEQRLFIKTPADMSTFAVTSNSLNGITVNTILQPNRRYELRYNGTAFDAKEV